MKHYDLAIVGGGIAGCTALWYAVQKNKNIIWFDLPARNSSSSVAAGMLNPIVLRRFTKSWNVDILLPFAQDFYRTLDQELEIKSFFEYPIYRVFASEDEKKLWTDKMNDERFKNYLALPDEDPDINNINGQHGYGKIKQGGYLDLNVFMDQLKTWARAQKNINYKEQLFEHQKLQEVVNGHTYGDMSFAKILFCEGTHIHDNPFFNYLPYRRTKGEVLEVKLPELNLEKKILSRSVFCLPKGDKIFKIGATFTHDDFTLTPTQKGKEEILNKFKKLYHGKVSIHQHIAGIRPTVKDRRPLLGNHPKHKNMFIFNGLGTKGVLLAPYFANAIINFTFEQEKIQPEADINRFEQQT